MIFPPPTGKSADPITGAYTVNDPLRIYGASRMQVLDMRGAADHLKNGFDLGKCSALRELDMESKTGGSTGWWLNIGTCQHLRTLNVRNQQQAKTGSSTSTELDLSAQTKLESLDARGTQVKSVSFAKGAPLTTACLPGTLTVLKQEYLSKLTLEDYSDVRTLIVEGCPGINWETLLARCTGVNRLRATGVDKTDDGTWLSKFMAMGGIDADGNATDTCALAGTVRLTRYMDEESYAKYVAHFPELNIRQPEYTMIEFDDSVADDANITNLDNNTGYDSGTAYTPSGHILQILSKRHRVLAKVTKKPTSQTVNMAGQDVPVNNLDGEMTYFPLDDEDSNKYADGTEAKLDGSEGDWMMYEPFFWSKGINDNLNNKHYSCYSSNDANHEPARPEARVLSLDDIKADAGGVQSGRKIMAGKGTLSGSYANDASYCVCKVSVSGFKRVRFPSVPGTNLVGSVFVDTDGTVVGSVVVPTITNKFEPGMYVIHDIPEGASTLHFTILSTAEFDKVVLSNSDRGTRLGGQRRAPVRRSRLHCNRFEVAFGHQWRQYLGEHDVVGLPLLQRAARHATDRRSDALAHRQLVLCEIWAQERPGAMWRRVAYERAHDRRHCKLRHDRHHRICGGEERKRKHCQQHCGWRHPSICLVSQQGRVRRCCRDAGEQHLLSWL